MSDSIRELYEGATPALTEADRELFMKVQRMVTPETSTGPQPVAMATPKVRGAGRDIGIA